MLNYEEFKDEIRCRLLPAMGEKYEKYVIEEMKVFKMGKNKDGFGVRKLNSNVNNRVMPTLYFDDLYRDYLNGEDFECVLTSVAQAMLRGLKDGKRIKKAASDNMNYDNVICQLVNADDYKSLLEDVPHRYFLDLAIIYRWCIDVNHNSFASAVIDNDIAQKLGYTEEELYKHAFKNTAKLFQPVAQSMQEIAFDLFVRGGACAEEAREMSKKLPDSDTIFFVSNGGNPKVGATVLLYSDKLKKLANRFSSDLFLLPLSSMEIIAIPSCYKQDLDAVYKSFFNLNNVNFENEEIISENIYYFDRVSGEISVIDPVLVGEDIEDA